MRSCRIAAMELRTSKTVALHPISRESQAWLNTPDGKPIALNSLRGKVVLIDFWAYSCINCQRAIPHVVGWYQAYRDSGFEVIGVHTPEYAFEKVPDNVAQGAADLGITYPVALDNGYSTWTNYRNRYWPAEYLGRRQRHGSPHQVRRRRLQRDREADQAVARPTRSRASSSRRLSTRPTPPRRPASRLRRISPSAKW